ncbi:hypothetical protein ACFL40_02920 [candidate division KSB1 bacterium]
MKNNYFIIIMLLLLFFQAGLSYSENTGNPNWIKIEIGKDNDGKLFVLLENNIMRCRYGWRHHKDPKEGQSYIREFLLKSADYNMGDWLDAAAGKRGPLTNAEIIYDGEDKKTVRLEWNNGDKAQEVTVYPNSLILKIDYTMIRGFPHLVDVGSHDGRKLENPVFVMHGAEEWQLMRKTNRDSSLINHENEHHRLTHDLYPMYPFPILDTPDWDGFAPTPLNYKGNFIIGVYNRENGIGYGRVMPYDVVNYLKLLDDGFEFFPFWRLPEDQRKFPFTGYLFLVDGGGASEILDTGRRTIGSFP